MSRKRGHPAAALTDPRIPGGDIAGPRGPTDRNSVIVDVTRAVLLDHTSGVLVHTRRREEADATAYGLMLEGRINQSPDRSKIMYLVDLDGLAAVAAECCSLAARAGVSLDEFMGAFGDALDRVAG